MQPQKKPAPTRRKWIRNTLFVVLVILASFFVPWNVYSLSSNPHPAGSYEEASQRIDALKANRLSEMNPACVTQFMTHGQKVDQVIVLVHGYTNCPKEFVELGKQFYDLGYNVFIAPLPHHGLKNRLNDEQGDLTANELAAYADQVVDIARGLGDHITILGYSCGGVVSAWIAQNRSDVDKAVVMSPAFGFLAIPTPLTAPVMNYVIAAPDVFVWWDPALQANDGFDYTYPRYSKHALAQIMRLGFSVQVNSWFKPPLAKRVIVVTNAYDDSVNNALTLKVAGHWRDHNAQLITYEFPATLELPHALVDSNKPTGNTPVVNQKLIELVTH
jgi:alpha-beta hydrolase superfamily lysophospholipase